MKKRAFLKHMGLLLPTVLMGKGLEEIFPKTKKSPFPYQLPALPYGYQALEPYIDQATMEIHHTRHHKAYIENLNKALEGKPFQNEPLESLFKRVQTLPVAIRNHGGGHWNHTFFWDILSPNPARPSEKMEKLISTHFGSVSACKDAFKKAALSQFGSGWAWLVWDGNVLKISTTPNQDNPLMDVAEVQGTPIVGLDVWEHAYYLKYQNKRADYIDAFWNVLDWAAVERKWLQIKK